MDRPIDKVIRIIGQIRNGEKKGDAAWEAFITIKAFLKQENLEVSEDSTWQKLDFSGVLDFRDFFLRQAGTFESAWIPTRFDQILELPEGVLGVARGIMDDVKANRKTGYALFLATKFLLKAQGLVPSTDQAWHAAGIAGGVSELRALFQRSAAPFAGDPQAFESLLYSTSDYKPR